MANRMCVCNIHGRRSGRSYRPRQYVPALREKTEAEWAGKTEAEIKAELQRDQSNDTVQGYRVTDTLVVSDKEVVLSIYLARRDRTNQMRIVRTGEEWKIAGKPGK